LSRDYYGIPVGKVEGDYYGIKMLVGGREKG